MMKREDITAAYVYRQIQHETNLSEIALCVLHKPCRSALRCAEPQHTGMLNFDQVKEIWNSQHPHIATPASVDGLTYQNECLCMVEIKGGVDFLRHEPLANKKQLTDKQVEIFQDKIGRKIGKFDFRKKLADSLRICEDFLQINNLPELFPIEYLVVTDIERNENPLMNLMENLNFLGENSSDWANYYVKTLQHHANATRVRGITPKIVCCKEFDAFIRRI